MNFRKQHTIDPVPMQLAPLVDVLLLLVIFFAVSYKFGQDEQLMDISVPATEEGKERKTSVGEIVINVKADGSMVVNGQDNTHEELLAKLKNIASVYKDQAVIIRGDIKTEYDHIVKVLATCQKAGIWNVAFATKRPEAEQPSK